MASLLMTLPCIVYKEEEKSIFFLATII